MKSDIELVSEVRNGNRKSFSELVQRHQRALLRLSLRFTKEPASAEDIVQESFLKAYQKLHLFEGRASFKSWLYQIALNTARNRYRSRNASREVSTESGSVEDLPLADDSSAGASAEVGLLQAGVRERIRHEVESLPERQRIALTLRIFEDLSFKEIAEIMECPYDTAKANYRHAVLRIKDRLEETGMWEEARTDLEIMRLNGPTPVGAFSRTENNLSEVDV